MGILFTFETHNLYGLLLLLPPLGSIAANPLVLNVDHKIMTKEMPKRSSRVYKDDSPLLMYWILHLHLEFIQAK